MKVAIYLRVSSKEQDNRAQEKALRDYSSIRGFDIVSVYEDKATGTNTNRPAFRGMFLDAALGKFDVILTWKLDRFCRNVKDFCDSIIYLQTHGVKFISMIDSIDLTTPMGEFISHIFAAIAQLESKNTSLRVKAMWDAKRARGESMARPGRRKHDYRAVAESYSRTQNMQATADEMGLTKGAVSKIVRIYKEERERPLTLVQ